MVVIKWLPRWGGWLARQMMWSLWPGLRSALIMAQRKKDGILWRGLFRTMITPTFPREGRKQPPLTWDRQLDWSCYTSRVQYLRDCSAHIVCITYWSCNKDETGLVTRWSCNEPRCVFRHRMRCETESLLLKQCSPWAYVLLSKHSDRDWVPNVRTKFKVFLNDNYAIPFQSGLLITSKALKVGVPPWQGTWRS